LFSFLFVFFYGLGLQGKIMAVQQKGEQFFFLAGVLLTAIVVAGFLPPVFSMADGPLSLPLLYPAHGAILLSWFVLFSLQAKLVEFDRVRTEQVIDHINQHAQSDKGAAVSIINLMTITAKYQIRA
jgi:hypothetical protein